jgi:hypothetical protein
MWIATSEGLVNLDRFDSVRAERVDESSVLVLYADGTDAAYIKCSSHEQADSWVRRIIDGLRAGDAIVELS